MVTKARPRAAVRNADAMRERILRALERIILRDGLSRVGVNALAREAGCDKVLLYRYFGDLDGLYEAYAEQSEFWWTVSELTEGIDPRRTPIAVAMSRLLRRHAEAIRGRAVTLAVLAAELEVRSHLVIALEKVRERRSLELNAWIETHYRLPRGRDVAAIAMLLAVALNYLAVRARRVRVMGGVGIKNDEDWRRILAAADSLIEAVLEQR